MTDNPLPPPADYAGPPRAPGPRRRRDAAIAMPLLLVLAVLVACSVATNAGSPGAATHPTTGPAASAAAAPCLSSGAAASPDAMGTTDSAQMSLSTFIGQETGTRLAGNAPSTVDAAQVKTLGDQTPDGAAVDACANQITFTGATASLVVEAVPPDNPDMTFRIAGLIDPAVVVRQGTVVTVEFVNADTDQAHGWLVTAQQPPFAFRPATAAAIASAQAQVIGDPVNGLKGAEVISFTAGPAGSYQYICPMPGHAEMGMHAAFIVTP